MKKQPKPLPPPFSVGARVRYLGKSELRMGSRENPEEMVTILAPGLEVVIDSIREGRQRRLIDLGDEDEPFLDETRNGRSVYHIGGHGQHIFAEDANKWEVLDMECVTI